MPSTLHLPGQIIWRLVREIPLHNLREGVVQEFKWTSAPGTLLCAHLSRQIRESDDTSRCEILLITLSGDRPRKMEDLRTGRCSALNQKIKFRGATTTASAKYCWSRYLEIESRIRPSRTVAAHSTVRSNFEERQLQQAQNTADHATWRSK